MRELGASLAASILISASASAQDLPSMRGPDRVDEESTRALREATTDPSFLTEWVDYVPEHDSVPSPRDFLGYVIGTPGALTPPERIVEYFDELARASERVRVFRMGASHGGREMVLAAIADEASLERLDAIRAANARLADPRKTSEEEARAIAASVPPTYFVTAGLHSPELGPPEMVMEMAYRLAVSEQPHIREIRAGVVTLICPVLEMDGRARAVDWYRRHMTEVTDRDDAPPRMAPYWGDYTAHDNNRDGLQQSQPLTRNFTDTFHEWLPVVSLDLHESVPLLYVSTGTGPYNPTIDPITVTEWQWMAAWDVGVATQMGLRGVWTWGFYTGWYPGYLLWVTNTHNATGRFYETFGNGHPGTFPRDLTSSSYAGRRVETREWYRAWPPEKELTWSMRNNTNYMQTGVLAGLQLAARNGEELLLNFWRKGRNATLHGESEVPHAFHVPLAQRDMASLRQLAWLLERHRIEVHLATDAATIGEASIAAGDLLVRLDQPYGPFARTLLAPADFPASAEHQPYDDVAWSLDLMLGLDVNPIDDPTVFDLPMERATGTLDLEPRVHVGPGPRYIVDHTGNVALAGLCWALGDARVEALTEEWDDHPAGSLVIEGLDVSRAAELARAHLVDFRTIVRTPPTTPVNLPRVALFHTWTYTQDSGWARYSVEELGIPYTLIDKDDLRTGDLAERFDVILVPDQRGISLATIVHGIDSKWSPLAYTKTDEFPSHGAIDSSPDITGGMGFEGLAHLQDFVRAGGLLVTLGGAGTLVSDSGLAPNVRKQPAAGTPGSHVTVKVLRPEHPVTWGYEEITHVFHGNSPRFDVPDRLRGRALVQYGTRTRAQARRQADEKADIPVDDPAPAREGDEEEKAPAPALCLSGIVRDPSALERVPAVLDVPVGEGHVLVFSWNPLHRHQNLHDFTFLTNALLFHDDFPDVPSEEEMLEREEGR